MSGPRRIVGPVTVHAAAGTLGGGGIGLALVQIIVFAWPGLEPITEPLTALVVWALAVAGALLGGWAAPPGASSREAGRGHGTP